MTDENQTKHRKLPVDTELIVKYLQELTIPEETILVEDWMKESEENRTEVKQLAEIFFTKRAYDRMISRDSSIPWQKVQARLQGKKSVKFRSRAFIYAAASFIGAIILSTSYIYLRDREIISGGTNYIVAEANPGMRTRINLSDGTVVYLNSGSKFTYPDEFHGDSRTVTLNGEAFFKVHKNEDRPFIVRTNDNRASIQVLGTSFNVQCFENDNEFTTTLVEGLVNVKIHRKNGSNSLLKLTPSDKIIFDKETDSLSICKTNTEIETAWTRNRLIFRNHPMPQVLKILSYNYNAEFDVRNPAISSYRFTGTFQNRQLPQILEYLKISSNIDYTISYPQSDDSFETKKMKIILK